MRKPGFIAALCLAHLISLWASSAACAGADFECILTSDRETYTLGEHPKFTVRIANNTSHEVWLMGCLDGSTDGGRFPSCPLTIIKPPGAPDEVRHRCGNMNTLRTEDFVAIAPGASFDPCGKGFGWPAEFARFPARQPGVYRVRFSYSTKSHQISDYFGDERLAALLGGSSRGLPKLLPEIPPLFARISHIELQSNELTLTFLPKSQ